MKPSIAIILTSIERDKALFQALKSIMDNLQENWMVIIGYQSNNKIVEFSHPQVYMYNLPYNCGISFARNDMIVKARALGCKYVLLTADSITFDKSMKDVEGVALGMDIEQYELCGLNLNNRIPWEADLDLVQIPERSFVLDFIDPRQKLIKSYVPCSIVRNFWIAKTEALRKVPYDEQLIMCEHEDFFWRMKIEGLPVCCTNLCSGTYNKSENTPEYDKLRKQNFRIGMQRLVNKYYLNHWITYKNIERIHQ